MMTVTSRVTLALRFRECQSNDVADLTVRPDGTIIVSSGDDTLVYTPYAVSAPDGELIAHESRGGRLAAVWSTAVGEAFVEISHLGHGPAGGELVMVVTEPGAPARVALGALVEDVVPTEAPTSWPAALDLALGLIVDDTLDSGDKDAVEEFHQRLLEVVHGL